MCLPADVRPKTCIYKEKEKEREKEDGPSRHFPVSACDIKMCLCECTSLFICVSVCLCKHTCVRVCIFLCTSERVSSMNIIMYLQE